MTDDVGTTMNRPCEPASARIKQKGAAVGSGRALSRGKDVVRLSVSAEGASGTG